MLDFVRPEIKCLAHENNRYAKFVLQPLERGFGTTLGNSLRRVLLSFIPGAAITSVQIEGVLHEFSTIPGVREDVMEILMNLREVCIKVDESIYPDPGQPIVVTFQKSGKGRVVAADIELPTGVEIVNASAPIATMTDDSSSLSMTLTIERGRGYVPANARQGRGSKPIGVISMDAIFTPTRKVNFHVEPTRMGHRTDLDRLILEIWTNGTISPEGAITTAAHWLDNYLRSLFVLPTEVEEEGVAPTELRDQELLQRKVSTLEFSVRTSNCLRGEQIETIEDLISRSPSEVLSIKNFGEKSLEEVTQKLVDLGLSLRQESE